MVIHPISLVSNFTVISNGKKLKRRLLFLFVFFQLKFPQSNTPYLNTLIEAFFLHNTIFYVSTTSAVSGY